MAGEEGRISLKALEKAGIPLHGDFYTRVARSIQALLGQDPQQMGSQGGLPVLTLGNQIHFEATVLDATGAPYRKNGRQWDLAVGISAGANFGEWQVYNVIPAATGSQPAPQVPYRVLVIDAIDWQGASTATLGISPGEDTQAGLNVQNALPNLLEEPPMDLTSIRKADTARIRLSTGSLAAPTPIRAIVRGLPNVGAAGIFQKALGGLCIFPNESLLCLMGTSAIAGYFGVTGRLVEFGLQAPQS